MSPAMPVARCAAATASGAMGSAMALAAICWNCWVSAPHHCMAWPMAAAWAGSSLGAEASGPEALLPASADAAAAAAAGGSAGGCAGAACGFSCLPALPAEDMGQSEWSDCPALAAPLPAVAAAAVAAAAAGNWKACASSPMLTFMPCRVDSVMRCTSRAWMVAASALPFWSSQNCTALSSVMRLSTSSMLTVAATHSGRRPRGRAVADPALWARPCRKSKPGMNLPKPKEDASLMAALARTGLEEHAGEGCRPCSQLNPGTRQVHGKSCACGCAQTRCNGAGSVRMACVAAAVARCRGSRRAGRHGAHGDLQAQARGFALGVLEHQGDGHLAVLEQRALELLQHDVVAAGLQVHGHALGQVQAVDGAHAHHIAFHLHFMHLGQAGGGRRSEEHTSELQSPCNLVCRLLLEKKKNKPIIHYYVQNIKHVLFILTDDDLTFDCTVAFEICYMLCQS